MVRTPVSGEKIPAQRASDHKLTIVAGRQSQISYFASRAGRLWGGTLRAAPLVPVSASWGAPVFADFEPLRELLGALRELGPRPSRAG
eukprot:7003653-Alexandrium_andersonii.AAC.1